jgi:hypothetical protein
MRYPGFLLATLALTLTACNQDSSPAVGQKLTVPLVTERDHLEVGTVTVSNSETTLRVEIFAAGGWTLEKVRVAAGTSLDCIPQTCQGQPLPERFPLRSKLGSVKKVEFQVPLLVEPGTQLFFAVQADVREKAPPPKKGQDPVAQDSGMESAWGLGTPFPKKPAAMYFTYTVQKNSPPSLEGLYRTQTQEQWGGAASPGDAPGYLVGHFQPVYPGGVTIGATNPGFTARFTTAQAVMNFLPQNGPAIPLTGNRTNPTNLSNGLAGETLALTLNVDFDDHDAAFSAGVDLLGDLVVADAASACFGRPVREVLSMANQMLAGFGDTLGISPDVLLDCVRSINRNFEDGVVDRGYLGLPIP